MATNLSFSFRNLASTGESGRNTLIRVSRTSRAMILGAYKITNENATVSSPQKRKMIFEEVRWFTA
jgi:hypothetical protein